MCENFVLIFFHKLGSKRNAEVLASLRKNPCVDLMPCSVIQEMFPVYFPRNYVLDFFPYEHDRKEEVLFAKGQII